MVTYFTTTATAIDKSKAMNNNFCPLKTKIALPFQNSQIPVFKRAVSLFVFPTSNKLYPYLHAHANHRELYVYSCNT